MDEYLDSDTDEGRMEDEEKGLGDQEGEGVDDEEEEDFHGCGNMLQGYYSCLGVS
jgi:hypothetical protein